MYNSQEIIFIRRGLCCKSGATAASSGEYSQKENTYTKIAIDTVQNATLFPFSISVCILVLLIV